MQDVDKLPSLATGRVGDWVDGQYNWGGVEERRGRILTRCGLDQLIKRVSIERYRERRRVVREKRRGGEETVKKKWWGGGVT